MNEMGPQSSVNGEKQSPVEYDVVVVGAGFAGLYSLHRLRELGFSVRVFEAADGVGGTWFWNCYPGARCDVESMEYSYSFSEELEQEWEWTEKYPSQPEILRYINHVADRFDLRRDIQLNTRVTTAEFDEDTNGWTVQTDDGARYSAQYCVMASGCLSAPKDPDFKGLASFTGDWYMTSCWPKEEIDFTGKRVGVIGTGSSAIQAIPVIAEQADLVTVFQRTPGFSVPAMNKPLDQEFQRQLKARYREHRIAARESMFGVPVAMPEKAAMEYTPEQQRADLEARWQAGGAAPFMLAFTDSLIDEQANQVVAEFVRDKIRATVKDQEVAELLCRQDYPLGTKRLCVDTGYFEVYNRDNVNLVDIRNAPIEEITPHGLRTGGVEYEFDVIVFAIGFDAMTGALFDIDIHGTDGVALREQWADGPRTYLGLATAGFPNLFMITGPGSPSVLSNMIVSIEQHVDWIADCLTYMRERDLTRIEATQQAQNEWVQHVDEVGQTTLFPRANSWYVGANVPGKPRVFMPYVGGVGPYRETCNAVAEKGYEGFALAGAPAGGGAHGEPASLAADAA